MFLGHPNIYFDKLVSLATSSLPAAIHFLLGVTSPAAALADLCPAPSEQPASAGVEDDFRARLRQHGIAYSGEWVGEVSSVVDGGLHQASSSRHLFTFDVELDLEPIFGLESGTLFAQFLSVSAENGGTADAGDIQTYSNIENDRALSVIYEAWYQQQLLDGRVRIKIGKVDANSEFAAVDTAGDFASSSAGFSPTIVGFPSYPDPGMSFNAFFKTVARRSFTVTLGYGYYDGAAGVDGIEIGSRGPSTFFGKDRSDDYFHIAEAEMTWEHLGSLPAGRLALGGWRHTGEFQTVSNQVRGGTDGLYALFEQRVLSVEPSAGGKSLDLFAQYGSADEIASEITQHLGAGVVARGWVARRPDDSMGLYVTFAGLSRAAELELGNDETAVEIYYRAEFRSGFFLQPAVHYIDSPSGDHAVEDPRIVAVRAGFSF